MYPNAYWDASNTGSIITALDRQQYHAQYSTFYDPDPIYCIIYCSYLFYNAAGDTTGVVGYNVDNVYVSVSRLQLI